MDFRLRDFQREDFERLWSIDQRCFPSGISYTRLELKFYMHRRGAFTLVAEKVGPELTPEAVGFIVAESGRGGVGHIITIDVLPTVRRFGVGSRLLTAAEDRLRSAQCQTVFLETAVDNRTALSFYKRHKYFLIRTVPRYYSNGLDAFVLQKDLLSQEGAASVLA
ncbi:MAG TPA: N-acetyltransferase [Terriglobales bacterium]|nr:N-acetyltransferase [Terriglobales bacterium]